MATMKYNNGLLLIITLMHLSASQLRCEVIQDPFANPSQSSQNPDDQGGSQSGINQGNFSNGLSSGYFNGVRADENTVKENQENQSRGREYKAGDAQAQGNTGAGVAIGVGTAMLATGSVMAASPIIPVAIAGWDLIAKGALELAQGAANASSAADNRDQKNTLLNNSDQRSGGNTAPKTPEISSPELDNALASTGVNVDDFKQRLARGEFRNEEDVLRALGKNNVSPSDAAEAQNIVNAELNNIMGNKNGDPGRAQNAVVTGDDENRSATASSDPDSVSSVATVGHTDTQVGNPDLKLDGGRSTAEDRGITFASRKDKNGSEVTGEGSASSGLFDPRGFLNGLLGPNATPEQFANAMTAFRQELSSMGIQMNVPGQTIFGTAHRHYSNFAKWRKNNRVQPKLAVR